MGERAGGGDREAEVMLSCCSPPDCSWSVGFVGAESGGVGCINRNGWGKWLFECCYRLLRSVVSSFHLEKIKCSTLTEYADLRGLDLPVDFFLSLLSAYSECVGRFAAKHR